MLDVFNIAKPQNCDIQIFRGFASTAPGTEARNWQTWNKPRGVSHVYMLLIGGGGQGDATNGGGSGAVTVWYGAAQNVPDSLALYVRGTTPSAWDTTVAYRSTSGVPITLLTGQSASSSTGSPATTAGVFAASGFYTSTAGQSNSGITPSATTFLSAGTTNTGQTVTANYGYQTNITGVSGAGYFQLQPIIVGVGSAGATSAGIGCGTNINGTTGGPGMILIASW